MSKETKEEAIDSSVEEQTDVNETIETDSYEELLEKKDNLEKLLLRATADLDNAIKRTASEVDKAHKYGVERLLNELLPAVSYTHLTLPTKA